MLRTSFAVLLAASLLAACAAPASDVVLPAATDAGSAARAPAPAASPAPPPAQPARARAAQAPASEPAADEGPITVTKAREQCWMKYETDPAARNADLDKKVKLVEACVTARMNASIGR